MNNEEKTPEHCEAPGCDGDVDYIAPGYWCEKHWYMWWDWPEEKPEPEWMTDKDGTRLEIDE